MGLALSLLKLLFFLCTCIAAQHLLESHVEREFQSCKLVDASFYCRTLDKLHILWDVFSSCAKYGEQQLVVAVNSANLFLFQFPPEAMPNGSLSLSISSLQSPNHLLNSRKKETVVHFNFAVTLAAMLIIFYFLCVAVGAVANLIRTIVFCLWGFLVVRILLILMAMFALEVTINGAAPFFQQVQGGRKHADEL